ncbi:MAG TPA: hypothetical protein VIF62_01890 [Labilithrix sp.]
MSEARVLECVRCGAAVAFRAPACLYCRAAQTWSDAPPILHRTARIFGHRYPPDPPLGATVLKDVVATPEGARVSVGSKRSKLAVSTAVQRRNGCVAVTGVALDADMGFGALVRAYAEGSIFGAYSAVVVPAYRAVALSRLLEGGEVSELIELSGWESTTAVRPLGEPNTVEIRYADSVLQVLVNDVRIITFVDAGIGYGKIGWRAVSLGDPGSVLLRGIEVFDVGAR